MEARANAAAALDALDWGDKVVAVRINGLTTPWAIGDLLAVARCPRLDMVLIPKVETAEDVRFVDRLLTMMELEQPRDRPLGIEILIETAKGLANVEAIAASSERLEAIIFGVGDYSIELQNFDLVFGQARTDYAVIAADEDGNMRRHLGDQWHFALARIANACRAYGLRPIDGPYTDYGDAEGYRASCMRSRALGFEGKWAIHPNQVSIANEVYTPPAAQIAWARDIEGKMATAAAEGRGAIGLDNVLIDRAHVLLADKILRRAELIGIAP